MSEQDKQAARRFIEAYASADAETLRQVMAPDAVDHNPLPGQRPGSEGVIDGAKMFKSAFPDMSITVERVVAEGDLVVQSGTASGTNRGELLGMPATNKSATISWMDMYRFANGKITEMWHLEDIAGMMQQLGMMPS